MSRSVYHVAKIAHHPDALRALREGEATVPILVRWYPTNVCPHACHFCSYGSGPAALREKITSNPPRAAWKNTERMDPREQMPLEKMLETVACLQQLGVKAVEVSGGGEPLAYTHIDAMLSALSDTALEFALVTNGTLLDAAMAKRIAALQFTWARVSIDAGSAEDYCAIRMCPPRHWELAWEAVERLVAAKRHPEARVGVGFTVDRINAAGLYACIQRAREVGADNVRVALSFTPDGTDRWASVLETVHEQADAALRDLSSPDFTVYDLTRERQHNVEHGWQQYPYCYWKDVGCVIGADQNIYACCSWAYNTQGLLGSIREQSFTELWTGDGARWRRQHDPRRDCRIHCLYETRNKAALRLMLDPEPVTDPAPPHVNFL